MDFNCLAEIVGFPLDPQQVNLLWRGQQQPRNSKLLNKRVIFEVSLGPAIGAFSFLPAGPILCHVAFCGGKQWLSTAQALRA